MKRKKLLYILNCFISLNITPKSNPIDFITNALTHKNIIFQQEYDTYWGNLFLHERNISIKTRASSFKQLLKENNFYNNHKFYLGFSSSAYQFEGGIGDTCSWHHFAIKHNMTLPNKACGFWNNYRTMIQEMKEEAYINAFRLSIEWARVEPQEGMYDFDALDHYRVIIKTLREFDIEPLIVLNHYTVPTWFESKGGFLNKANIDFFVDFATKVYMYTHDIAQFYSTCNAPEGIAFKGWYTLTGAPGEKKSAQNTLTVMKNILESHVRIYKRIKGNPLKKSMGYWQKLQLEYDKEASKHNKPKFIIPEPMIGIQKNIIQFDIAYDNKKQYLLAPITDLINRKASGLSDSPFYNFFTTGTFNITSTIPSINVKNYNKLAPYTLDWIGVNYYGNKKRFLASDVIDTNPRLKTQNENYRYYPQGLYRATKEIYGKICNPIKKQFGKEIPIWITENGIAAIDEQQRADFNSDIIAVLHHLVKEGLPVIGYTQWASHDNWEWGAPIGSKRYGNFFVDFNNINKKHILKPGAKILTEFMKYAN